MPTTVLDTMPEEKKRGFLKKLVRSRSHSHAHEKVHTSAASPVPGTQTQSQPPSPPPALPPLDTNGHHIKSYSKSPTSPQLARKPSVSHTGVQRAATFSHAAQQRVPANGTMIATGSKPPLKSHTRPASTSISGKMTNPFAKHAEVSDLLGIGTNIAAPRNSTSAHSQRQMSNHMNHPAAGSPSQYNTPFGPGSRTPSVSSMQGFSGLSNLGMNNNTSLDGEKKNVLPLPLKDPNDYLPENMKQNVVLFSDSFQLPDKNSGKDRKLGDGASAQVFVVQHKASHKYYAFKRFLLLDKEEPEHLYQRAAKEFVIAKKLSGHNHVVDTFAIMKVQSTIGLVRGWGFVLEYCKGGDLFSLISRTGWKSAPPMEKLCIFKQICCGLKFMHDNGIVHRDLKPENVLLTDTGCCKLTDFGVADYGREDPSDQTSPVAMSTMFVGSPPYVAPEVFSVKEGHTQAYNPFLMDSWSLGMILFCLFYKSTPLQNLNVNPYREMFKMFESIFHNEHYMDPETKLGPVGEFKWIKEFPSFTVARWAFGLTRVDPEKRYTMDTLFADTTFQGLECCIDEDTDHHEQYWDTCCHMLEPPHTEEKTSPIVKAKSMLDFDGPASAPATTAPMVIPPQRGGATFSSGTPPPTTPSPTPPMSATIPSPTLTKESSSLPTLAEVSESVSTSPTTDMTNLKLNDSSVFYDAQSTTQKNPSQESLLTFSARVNSPPRSMIADAEADSPTLATPHNSQLMMRASSFSSMTSKTSQRSTTSSSGAAKRKKKHHHMDVPNFPSNGSFVQKKK